MIGPAKRERLAMMAIAGGLLAALSLSMATAPPRPRAEWMDPDRIPSHRSSAAVLTPEEITACRDALDAARRGGVVRGRPSPDRVAVDAARWNALSAAGRTALLHALGCDRWHAATPPPGKELIAVDAETGKLLSTLRAAPRAPHPLR